MFRHVPNALTVLRLVLAFVFFAVLAFYQYDGRGDPSRLNVAFVVYAVALGTDFLDGYLARRWKVETRFGRIVDPFVDKILVLGAFIFFAGKNFIIPDSGSSDPALRRMVVKTITGVSPILVVILLARELLVTSFRGLSESSGQNFGAAMAGKVKMVFQSVTILIILMYVNYLDWLARHHYEPYARWFRDLAIWLTVAVTVYSGLIYIQRAWSVYRASVAEQTPVSK